MGNKKILYLSRHDVEKVNVSMTEIIKAIETMFVEKGQGKVEMPPKPGIHTRPDAFIHAMPAYIPSLNSAGVKWVSGYPENQSKGLPYISGLIILNDPETGFPICVMDCTWVTAMRTGAATAVAANKLAKEESSSIGIIACGVQGRSNLEALSCIFEIEQVKAYDINQNAAENYASEMNENLGLTVEVVSSAREAIENLDIVVTSGPILKHPNPVIERDWLKKGAFGSLVDFDSYWTPEAMNQVSKIYTDDVKQLEYYKSVGYFEKIPSVIGDLGELLNNKIVGRENDGERILAMNLGLATDDIAVAPLIFHKAQELNIGIELNL
ncbi:MAG: Alanine dehydrogenase [Candidatus Heimdallarchaeota archaeon LC_2]|nr:MAG: Alanine dehydrogenase [Candidatus Heimdallarchaeota archaeon LC_2]